MSAEHSLNTELLSSDVAPWVARIRLELADGVRLECNNREWELTAGGFNFSFRLPQGETFKILSKLREEGCSLFELVRGADRQSDPLCVREQMQRLWRQGLLVQILLNGGKKSAILHNFGDAPLFSSETGHPLHTCYLSSCLSAGCDCGHPTVHPHGPH